MIALSTPDDRAAAAAEYVLGTLSADDADAVVQAARDDRALRREIYGWQDRLLPLTARVPAVAPSAALWSRVDALVGAVADADRLASPKGAPAAVPVAWWRRLKTWQSIAALAVAASLLLSIALVTRIAVPEPPARYIAVLQAPDSQATGYVVEVTAGRSVRLVPVAQGLQVPAGRALQFWTKPQNASGPTSLGLVRAGETVELPVSRLPAVEAQTLFEITLEPETGSPIGRPTGPILYVGRTVAL